MTESGTMRSVWTWLNRDVLGLPLWWLMLVTLSSVLAALGPIGDLWPFWVPVPGSEPCLSGELCV